MIRSRQNRVKIGHIFETFESGRHPTNGKLGSDINKLRLFTPELSTSFFSPRENLGRIRTTRNLAINNRNDKTASKADGISFDVLSPK